MASWHRLQPADCYNCTDLSQDYDCSQCNFYDIYPNATQFVPAAEIVLKTFLFATVTTVSLIGNSLILWVLWILPDARSSTNLLIGNMALAHLPTAAVYCSVGIYKFVSGHNFLAGPFMCQYELCFKFCCLTATNLSLVTMAGDRLKNFYWPTSRKITMRQTTMICIVIWLFSVGFGLLFSTVRRFKQVDWRDLLEYRCMDASKHHYDLWMACLALLVYIPITTMVILYSLIVKKLWQFEEMMSTTLENEKRSYSRPVIQMIWLYLMVTIICYIPFQFLLIRREIIFPKRNENYEDWEIRWDLCRHLFFCIYTAVNPFIFGFANMTFRTTVKNRFLRSPRSGQADQLVNVVN